MGGLLDLLDKMVVSNAQKVFLNLILLNLDSQCK